LKPAQDAVAVDKILAGDAWLKDINLLLAWRLDPSLNDDTVFCLRLFEQGPASRSGLPGILSIRRLLAHKPSARLKSGTSFCKYVHASQLF
jgi:hypothetical protein